MILEKNLKALKERFPETILNSKESNNLEILISKSGDPTAIYKGLYLHSKHNPKREASKQAAQIKKADLIVLGGFGLGYQCEEVIRSYPKTAVVVIEPDREIFFEALKYRDLSDLIRNCNINFAVGEDFSYIKNFFIPGKVKSISLLTLTARVNSNSDYFINLKECIDTYLERIKVNRNTLFKFGKLWVKNQCKNIPYMGYKNDLNKVFNKFTNIPGIIVSAGPSMELIIPHLKEIKDRFVILAVDTALKSLLDEGLEPDFVMSIDSQYWNSRHLTGAECKKTILIADSSIQSGGLRPFKNRVFFTKSSFPLGRYFESVRSSLPKIASGGSVSTNIWDFARQLGLKEIYFIGQDLGFPGNITHYKNSYFEKNMLITSTKTNPLETQSFNYIYSGYPNLVESNSGEMIVSDERMKIYIKWFKEKILTENHNKTYTLSPRGCKIDGITYKNVGSLLNYDKKREEIDKTLDILKIEEPNFYINPLVTAGTNFKNALKELEDHAIAAYKTCNNIEEKIKTGEDISEELKKLDEIDRSIINSKYSQTLSFMIEPFIESINSGEDKSPMEAFKLSMELYKKLKSTANLHIKHIENSLKKIKISLK